MSDFMRWLHANYIRPQLDAVPLEEYDTHFDLVKNDLPPSAWVALDKCLEFTAIHAFALGVRTGAGMARHIPVS